MVTLRKKKKGNTVYYYLEHSIRIKGKVEKKEKYLGKKVPKNLDKIKKEFLNEIYAEKWFKKLDQIKKGFSKEFRKMPKSAVRKYLENFMVKFTYNTNRIEGSTLTLRETANLLEGGITPSNKPINDVKEAESHRKLFYEMLEYKKDLGYSIFLYWHKLLLGDTKLDIAGKIRRHQVEISGSKFVPPSPVEMEPLLRDFFRWHNREKNRIHPVELAALAHQKFVTIHPFADGNGRMGRIIMNFILHKNGFPMLNITYSNRSSYYTALERSQVKEQESIFVQYLIKRYIKTYRKHLKTLV